MRFLAFSVLAALAACATPPASAPAPQAQTQAPAADAPSAAARMLHAAGAANAPSQNDVVRMLGQPDLSRQDGAGAALTYRLDTCALLLVFTANARNEMRLAQAHATARRANEAAPTLDQCAAEATARRP